MILLVTLAAFALGVAWLVSRGLSIQLERVKEALDAPERHPLKRRQSDHSTTLDMSRPIYTGERRRHHELIF